MVSSLTASDNTCHVGALPSAYMRTTFDADVQPTQPVGSRPYLAARTSSSQSISFSRSVFARLVV